MSIVAKSSKEIGSYFSIDPTLICGDVENETNLFDNAQYLSTCRSAIKLILSQIDKNNKVALLPAFTCHAVVEPFISSGFQVAPYTINRDLTIDLDNLKSLVDTENPSVILFHDYFGFDTNSSLKKSGLIEYIQSKEIVIVDDQTQSMFSSYTHTNADYYIGSIRKWMGIPDGAFLQGNIEIPCITEDKELSKAKSKAMVYKHKYLTQNQGNKDTLLSLYKEAETILDLRLNAYIMSNLSKNLISKYDISSFCKARQNNARILLNYIEKCEYIRFVNNSPSDDEVPFYIPIFVEKNRAKFQKYLAQNGVFATVIWGCPQEYEGHISQDSQSIYNEILCVPCDQRYNEDDMKYIGQLMLDFKQEINNE